MTGIAAAKKCGKNLCGFSLLEVLVALFLQAFGMLGMTAMQIKALKTTHAALIDSRVQFLLADMAERIHGNKYSPYEIGFGEATPAAEQNCAAIVCSSEDLVLWDIRQWRSAIEDAVYLTDGESQITLDKISETYDISIRYEWSQLGPTDLIMKKRTVSLTVSAHI